MHLPLVARRIVNLEVGMVSDADGHGIGRKIFERGADFEHAIVEAVGHLDGVGEGELGHHLGMLPEFETAGNAG